MANRLEGHAKKFYKFFDNFTFTMGMGTDRYFTYEWRKMVLCKGHYKVIKVDDWITPPCNCDPNPLALRCFRTCEICGNYPVEGDIHCEYTEEWFTDTNITTYLDELTKYSYEQKKWIENEKGNASKEECYKRIETFVTMLRIHFDIRVPYICELIRREAENPL